MTNRADDWIAHHAAYAGQSLAAVDIASGRRYDYAAFDARIGRLARFLRDDAGIGPGDRVALLAQNTTDGFEIQFACWRLGAIFLPLNWRLAVPELAFIAADAGPKLLIHGDDFTASARAAVADGTRLLCLAYGGASEYEHAITAGAGAPSPAASDLDDVCTIMYTSGTTGRPKGAMVTHRMVLFNAINCAVAVRVTSASAGLTYLSPRAGASEYEHAITAGAGAPSPAASDLDDVCTIMYTSGTTGRPKGAMVTHRMVLFNAINCAVAVRVTSASAGLTYLPTFHIGGLNLYANPLFHTGGAVHVMRTFEPAAALAYLADTANGISHNYGVPTNFLFMSQEPGFAGADLGHVESIGIAGAAAPLALLEAYAAKGIFLQQGWGMTETTTIGTMLSKDKAFEKIGSSGQVVLHAEIRILDRDGRDLGPGEVGEIVIRGPIVTPGYWNRPEANAAAFVDGWFRTGDAARVDTEGFYTIVDRWKDMYISGGENVYPAEVEDVIFQLDGVLEAAVIGIPDATWGEIGRAFIVLKAGANIGPEAIRAHCRDNLASFKVPAEVAFLDELPHNATGKVMKHMLPRAAADSGG